MPNILDDVILPRDKFVYVKNDGDTDFVGVFNSKHYLIKAGDTELVNHYLYLHFAKMFDSHGKCPLVTVDENEGSVEYAKAKARQAEQIAQEKIEAAKKAAAEAEQAKKNLAQARVAANQVVEPPAPKKDK